MVQLDPTRRRKVTLIGYVSTATHDLARRLAAHDNPGDPKPALGPMLTRALVAYASRLGLPVMLPIPREATTTPPEPAKPHLAPVQLDEHASERVADPNAPALCLLCHAPLDDHGICLTGPCAGNPREMARADDARALTEAQGKEYPATRATIDASALVFADVDGVALGDIYMRTDDHRLITVLAYVNHPVDQRQPQPWNPQINLWRVNHPAGSAVAIAPLVRAGSLRKVSPT